MVLPAHAIVGLWPDTADHFEVARDTEQKIEVPLSSLGAQASSRAFPLAAVYEIHRHREDAPPTAKAIRGVRKVATLLAHQRAIALASPEMRAGLFDFCKKMAAAIKVAELHVPAGLGRLGAMHDFLAKDLERFPT